MGDICKDGVGIYECSSRFTTYIYHQRLGRFRIFISFYIITHTRYSIGDIMPGKGYKPKKAMKKNKVKKRK